MPSEGMLWSSCCFYGRTETASNLILRSHSIHSLTSINLQVVWVNIFGETLDCHLIHYILHQEKRSSSWGRVFVLRKLLPSFIACKWVLLNSYDSPWLPHPTRLAAETPPLPPTCTIPRTNAAWSDVLRIQTQYVMNQFPHPHWDFLSTTHRGSLLHILKL